MLLVLSFLFLGSKDESQILNDQRIFEALSDGKRAIEMFVQKHHRIPTNEEWISISLEYTENSIEPWYNSYEIHYFPNNFPDEVIEKYGEPQNQGYVIWLWRGEWSEYYVSWKNHFTVSPQSITTSL